MRRLNTTIAQLRALSATHRGDQSVAGPERLTDLEAHGSNPGALKARAYVPDAADQVPLVVVLHGCTQTADGYDVGSGWSELAERHGFAVLLPEQQRANNANLCFNWFSAVDAKRGRGEALSIRQMVGTVIEREAIDPARVFVTGLSAGGAMASVMLATYPELFAAGAVIAGLPFGAADTLPQALERMRGQGHVGSERYAALVRDASDHAGPWPAVSVWHGGGDHVVAPINAEATLGQWQRLHQVAPQPDSSDIVDGAARREWRDRSGRVCLTDYRIPGMGHGTPLSTTGARACGSPRAHMLDVGISSTWHIAESWGILNPDVVETGPKQIPMSEPRPVIPDRPRPPVANSAAADVQATIEAALRSAGLMR